MPSTDLGSCTDERGFCDFSPKRRTPSFAGYPVIQVVHRLQMCVIGNLLAYLPLRLRRLHYGNIGNERVETVFCLRCNREIEPRHKSVAVYMFAQTVGIKPRQKSAAQRICFCPPCSVSLAMGPPPEGALNLAAWNMLRDLVASDPALNQAAWESLRGISGLLVPSDSENATRPAYFEF